MPRNYIRKNPDRKLVTEAQVTRAKKLIAEGMSQRRAAEEVGISEGGLRKRLKNNNIPISLGRFKPTFNNVQELELKNHCKKLDDMFFGLTINDFRRLAYEFAAINKIENRFHHSSKMAGRDWVECFLRRHPELGVRQSAPTSLARAIGFNRSQVSRFYKNLKDLYDKYNFLPNNIYNMDETGMSTVPKKTPKVISMKGKKVVGKIVSAERGTTVTAVMCMNVMGHFVPPAFIYPRKRPRPHLLEGCPLQSVMMVSDSGFINSNIFINWLQHFQSFTHSSEDKPVLLILDNHSSHISLEATIYARENHIVMLTLPPHGSHKLQPLDIAVHGPLKTKYAIECEKWMNQHPGRGITQYEIASLFNAAYKQVANLSNAESGFRTTGIFPFADNLFDDADFAPSMVTDQLLRTNDPSEEESILPTNITSNENESHTDDDNVSPLIHDNDMPEIENILANNEDIISQCIPEKETRNPHNATVPLVELYPFPQMKEKRKRKRMSLKSEIITTSPFKNQLEEKRRIDEEKKKVKKPNFDPQPGTSGIKRKTKNLKRIHKQKKKDNVEEHNCPICKENFIDPPSEDWIQCILCELWFHEECTAYVTGAFICDFCQDNLNE